MNKTVKWTLSVVGGLIGAAALLWGGIGAGQALAAQQTYAGGSNGMMSGRMMNAGSMQGMMNGSTMQSMMNGGMMGNMPHGVMHEAMFNALATELGIERETLDQRIADGEGLYEIAESLGFSQEEFQQIHETAHQSAVQQMVDQGVLTQEQADWMQGHMIGSEFTPENCPHVNADPSTDNQ